MKKNTQLITLLLFVLLSNSCKKTGTSVPHSIRPACKPITESTTLSGNNSTYQYGYGDGGRITSIKKFTYGVLQYSSVVGDYTIITNPPPNSWPGGITTYVYEGSIFNALPTKMDISVTEQGITRTNIFTYFFFYDHKDRLIKIGEQTDHVIGDYEYDLSIIYDDHDNVAGLKYEFTTGPGTVTIIAASGYDDKPNPFAGVKGWPFLMHAAWDNYDPEPLFTALSKNNPLGYTLPDGFKRTMTYTYNDKGFPSKRLNTNTNSSGTYSFEETFDYQCP